MKVAVYLDTDCDGNDLLDNAGNPVAAGWYLYDWPLREPIGGPFDEPADAFMAGKTADQGDGVA